VNGVIIRKDGIWYAIFVVLLSGRCAAASGSDVLRDYSLYPLHPLEVLAYPLAQETQVSFKISCMEVSWTGSKVVSNSIYSKKFHSDLLLLYVSFISVTVMRLSSITHHL